MDIAKYFDKLDYRKLNILKKAWNTGKHTTESKTILRKVVAQTAEDMKNQRVAESELNPLKSASQPARTVTPQESGVSPQQPTLPSQTPVVNPIQESSKVFRKITGQ